jgi:hypothetical protein
VAHAYHILETSLLCYLKYCSSWPYPKLYTGGLVEHTKVIRIIMLKELGKITSELRDKESCSIMIIYAGAQSRE